MIMRELQVWSGELSCHLKMICCTSENSDVGMGNDEKHFFAILISHRKCYQITLIDSGVIEVLEKLFSLRHYKVFYVIGDRRCSSVFDWRQ